MNTGGGPPRSAGSGPVERELPPELRPFEAALASLSPGGDRLDYDLIMFRAGQLSAGGAARCSSRAWSAVMPAGLLAMTAAATMLLVMLLTRPVVERVQIVRIPAAEPPGTLSEQPAGIGERPPQVAGDDGMPAGEQDNAPEHRWASYGTSAWYSGRPAPPGSQMMSLDLLDRILRADLEPGAGPAATPARRIPQPEAPVSYHQQIRDLLDCLARPGLPGALSTFSHAPGADS